MFDWFESNAILLGAIAASMAIAGACFKPVRGLFKRNEASSEPTQLMRFPTKDDDHKEVVRSKNETISAEVRWADAANHFARAAELLESFEHLHRARKYEWRAGRLPEALRFGNDWSQFQKVGHKSSDLRP